MAANLSQQSLRHRLEREPESISIVSLAAEQRYWDGLEALLAGRLAAAVYFFGLSVEIHLKVAAAKVDGLPPTTDLRAWLNTTKQLMNVAPSVVPEGFHSILYWSGYIQRRRSVQSKPLPQDTAEKLRRHTMAVYATWWNEMRYHPEQVSANEAKMVYRAASWARARIADLWS